MGAHEGGAFFDILGAGSTFTRASEGSYYTQPPTDDEGDVAGKAFLAWAVANTPRIDSRDGVPMLLFEGARTNYFATSRDLGSMVDVGVPTLTDNTDGAPDGDATSRRVECDSGEAHYKASGGLTTGQPYIASIWMRGVSGQTLPQVYRASAGVPDAALAESPPPATWRRARISSTPTGTSITQFGNEGRDTSGFGGLVAGARDGMFAFPQIEGGSAASSAFATSVIRTTGVAATRSTDSLSWAAGTWPLDLADRGFLVELRPICTSAELAAVVGAAFNILGVGAGISDGLRLAVSAGVVRLQTNSNNVAVVNQQVSWAAAGQALSIYVRPRAGTVTLSGFTTGDGAYSASGGEFATRWAGLQPTSVLYICSRSGTSEFAFTRLSQKWRLL